MAWSASSAIACSAPGLNEGLCDAELIRREWLRRVQHEAA